METFNIPDDVLNLFLQPIKKRLGIKKKHTSIKGLFIAILSEVTDRINNMNEEKLKPLRDNIAKVIGPLTTIAEILQVLFQPLIALIPPQYLIIIVAILLLPTVVLPSLFLGGTAQYYLERWLKVPFSWSQKQLDNIPEVLQEHMVTITSKSHSPITFKLKEWFDLNSSERTAYYYEANSFQQSQLNALNKFKVVNPTVTSETIQPWMITTFPRFYPDIVLPDFEQEITLVKTSYLGWRRILPPVLNRTVEVLGSLFKKVSENALEDFDEHPARAVAKYLFIGWLGFLG